MIIPDLRHRIALSATRKDLRFEAILAYVPDEDEEMVAKTWLTDHEGYLVALTETAQDFVRTERIQGADIAAIAFMSDVAIICPYLQVLLRSVPLLYELVLEKLVSRRDDLLLANMRILAAM